MHRKQKNENFELHVESKKIWERLRVKKSEMSKEEKQNLVDNLTALVKSKDKEVCFVMIRNLIVTISAWRDAYVLTSEAKEKLKMSYQIILPR